MFKSEKVRFQRLSIQDVGTDYVYGEESYSRNESFKSYGLNAHRYKQLPLHKTFYTAFNTSSQPNQIYGAVKKTCKALIYQKDRYGTGPYVLHIFTPVIVVDGDLWSVTLTKTGKINAKKVDHLLLEVKQLMPHKDGLRYEEEGIYDVVSRKGFEKFLGTLQKDDLGIYLAWSNYIQPKKTRNKSQIRVRGASI